VKEWPVIGERLYAFWSLASQNLVAAAQKIGPELKAAGSWALSGVAGAGLGILSFVIAIIISGMLLANADKCTSMAERLAVRIAGEQGADFASIAGGTVRSVAQGVLGVAFIQAVLAGIGLLVMGVPAAGLWALLVMLLAIVQLPALLVLGPIIVYVFSVSSTVPAVIFMIYMILVSLSDSVLKPLLLGRGVELPMLVILIGAIGGMMLSGIVGLFVGAVILALGYKLFVAWLDRDATTGEPETAAAEAGSK
jgi:predicted PurR-regulated permease PerM